MRNQGKFRAFLTGAIFLIATGTTISFQSSNTIDAQDVKLTLLDNFSGSSMVSEVYGNYLLTTEGNNLVILDVSSPSMPQHRMTIKIGDSYVSDIAVSGHYAYISTLFDGIFIYDFSNIPEITRIGHISTRGNTEFLQTNGDYLYFKASESLYVYDITDPEEPVYVHDFYANSLNFTIKNDLMYVKNNKSFTVWDISDPQAPQELTSKDLDFTSTRMIKIDEDYLYIVNSTETKVFNIADVNDITEIATLDDGGGYAQDICFQGDIAYMVTTHGLSYIDISDKNDPRLIEHYEISSKPQQIDLIGNYAYVTTEEANIQVYNISDPDTLPNIGEWIGPIPSANQFYIDESGDYAYFGSQYSGFSIINISSPTNPYFVNRYRTGGKHTALTTFGNYIYAGISSNLEILDASNKENLQLLNVTSAGSPIIYLTVNDGYLYQLTDAEGMTIFDLTNPENPTKMGNALINGNQPNDIQFSGSHAFVADWKKGLRIIDISGPASPVEKETVAISDDANKVEILNNIAYVSRKWNVNIDIIDVSAPDNPVKVDSFVTSVRYPKDITIHNNVLYVLGNGAFQAFDLSNPYKPVIARDVINFPCYITGCSGIDDYLYIASDIMGLTIYSIEQKEIPDGLRVTNTNGYGPGSFKDALEKANKNVGPDTIRFAIPLSDERYEEADGFWRIYVQRHYPLPDITDDGLVILGDSQKEYLGYDPNPHGPEIGLTGQDIDNVNGLTVLADNVVISGMSIYRFDENGIYAQGVEDLNVWGCFIGVGPTGDLNGANKNGIYLTSHCNHCKLGNTGEGTSANTIAQNDNNGIVLSDSSTYNTISKNFIGTNQYYVKNNLENEYSGISMLNHSDHNEISGNVICNNDNYGIELDDCSNTIIQDNLIGTDKDVTKMLGNRMGIILNNNSQYNEITNNIIAFSETHGVYLPQDGALYNTISENSIFSNRYSGINNIGGANRSLLPPDIDDFDGTTITGSTGPACLVEFYSDSTNQGEIFLGSMTAGSDGAFQYSLTEPMTLPNLTAIAIDDSGNTSEFSAPIVTYIEEDKDQPLLPDTYALQSNYPNPFNAGTRIPYQLKETGQVSIELFNINGQKVRTLVNMRQQAGFHEITWNGNAVNSTPLSSGTYIVRMQVNGYTAQHKLLLLK